MTSARVQAALARAHAAAAHPVIAPANGERRSRTLAIGDPQAPLETFLTILDQHGAIDDSGAIPKDTALISMGDHFDWGSRGERERAADDAIALVAWLASHPADQVVMIAGNHDLARVGELSSVVDDDTFARVRSEADGIAKNDAAANSEFAKKTGFASAEIVHRDLSTFRVEQRLAVEALLRARRLRLAFARGDLLFVHAGVTLKEIAAVGVDTLMAPRDDDDSSKSRTRPAAIANALNAALDAAVDAREGSGNREPLVIEGVHVPGDATREGFGALYHRPARAISDEQRREGRRFDPRTLPRGTVQLVGHVRDKKCRELLGDWCDDAAHALGVLRHLVVDDGGVRYRHGVPDRIDRRAATIIFLDGGMNDVRAQPDVYELFDVERRGVAERRRDR
jgi:hypothetical protein